ncbi:MAG: sulfotransferase domain-containing protein [Alphaproteobacteria bacterium]
MFKKINLLNSMGGLAVLATISQAMAASERADYHELALVAGPARSGTSTLTAAVRACGFGLSPAAEAQKEELKEETASAESKLNPKGTLEDLLFLKIGREYMNRTNKDKPLPPTHPSMAKGRKNIGIFFNTVFKDSARVVLKHPALSKFGPILERRATQEDVGAQALNIKFSYVIALRHPADVGLSMHHAFHERNPEKTVEDYMEMWRENLQQALSSANIESERKITDGQEEVTLPPAAKRIFVKYEEIMKHTDEALTTLARRLGTTLAPEALESFKTEFLLQDVRKNHTPFMEDHPDYPMTESQRELRDHLEALYQAQD